MVHKLTTLALMLLSVRLTSLATAQTEAPILENGFTLRVLETGLPLLDASEAEFVDGKLFISDFGIDANGFNGAIYVYDVEDETTAILRSDSPLSAPRVSGFGRYSSLGMPAELIVPDFNSDFPDSCCAGRVFTLNLETLDLKVWGGIPPEPSFGANAVDVTFSPGGNFPSGGLIVSDIYREGDDVFRRLYHLDELGRPTVLYDEPENGSLDPSLSNILTRSIATSPGGAFPSGVFLANHTSARVFHFDEPTTGQLFSSDPALSNTIDLAFAPYSSPYFPEALYAFTTSRGETTVAPGVHAIDPEGNVTTIAANLPRNDSVSGLVFGGMAFDELGEKLYLAYGSRVIEITGVPDSGSE